MKEINLRKIRFAVLFVCAVFTFCFTGPVDVFADLQLPRRPILSHIMCIRMISVRRYSQLTISFQMILPERRM